MNQRSVWSKQYSNGKLRASSSILHFETYWTDRLIKSCVKKTMYNSTIQTIIENSSTNHFLTGTFNIILKGCGSVTRTIFWTLPPSDKVLVTVVTTATDWVQLTVDPWSLFFSSLRICHVSLITLCPCHFAEWYLFFKMCQSYGCVKMIWFDVVG